MINSDTQVTPKKVFCFFKNWDRKKLTDWRKKTTQNKGCPRFVMRASVKFIAYGFYHAMSTHLSTRIFSILTDKSCVTNTSECVQASTMTHSFECWFRYIKDRFVLWNKKIQFCVTTNLVFWIWKVNFYKKNRWFLFKIYNNNNNLQ